MRRAITDGNANRVRTKPNPIRGIVSARTAKHESRAIDARLFSHIQLVWLCGRNDFDRCGLQARILVECDLAIAANSNFIALKWVRGGCLAGVRSDQIGKGGARRAFGQKSDGSCGVTREGYAARLDVYGGARDRCCARSADDDFTLAEFVVADVDALEVEGEDLNESILGGDGARDGVGG